MKENKKELFNGLLKKLKTETLGVEHRNVIARELFNENQNIVFRVPFDDYGDMMIDNDGVAVLYDRYIQLLSENPDFDQKSVSCTVMDDKEYDNYCQYMSLKAVLEFVGIIG